MIRAEELEIVLPGGGGVGPWSGSIGPGEHVLVLGPSGAGKSTLLRALAGAVPQHVHGRVEGALSIDGIDPIRAGVAATSDRVGFVGQDPVAGVCLSRVADEVALPLENRRWRPADIGPRVAEVLAQVGAAHLQERETAELSGGELQRVALAAALAARPAVLLLDEPTAMLDAAGVAAVRRAVQGLPAEVAVILVEHRLDDWAGERGLAGLPPRTIALDERGRVLEDGPTAAVLARHGPRLAAQGCWLPREVPLGPARMTVRDLHVSRGGRPVLRGLELDLHGGEMVAIMGANGAGKSTLLESLASRSPRPGLVLQNPEDQFVAATVRAELAEGLPVGAADRVEAMLARIGLAEHAEASPYRLSGGQKRLLSIGAMLLHGREVLLADEPGYGLDRAAAVRTMRLLRDAADDGAAVLLTSHDARTAHRWADRVLRLEDGVLR
ncbi:ABC transporter ATP-binding protein [Brachybacterium phenoliresistens]|uniref:ABC transporter ATP-binding protein n=1 Tax=Brachybacterium phenoliresistens TaxID=396014 RepID=UPI0031E46953